MKMLSGFLCVMLVFFGIVGLANATLYDRGGGLIYDDVLDITWLQDANYAGTTMNWAPAVAWAEGLEYYDSVRGVTWDDWRLPQTLPVDGSTYDYGWSDDGSTDYGYNISAPASEYPGSTGSEMAYMFYNNLEGSRDSFPESTFTDGNGDSVSFQNLQPSVYWSGTEWGPWGDDMAWSFHFDDGCQYYEPMGGDEPGGLYAWAVRDGDVGAPSIANAGPDQVILDSKEVTLDGSQSSGTIESYEWVLHHRETSTDTLTDAVNPTVLELEPGFYEVELTVTDDNGLTDTDTMLLAVGPCAGWPQPNADLNIKKLKIKEKKHDAKLEVDGSIDLPELDVSDGDIVDSRITLELFGILSDGSDLVISSEDTLEIKYKKHLEIKKQKEHKKH